MWFLVTKKTEIWLQKQLSGYKKRRFYFWTTHIHKSSTINHSFYFRNMDCNLWASPIFEKTLWDLLYEVENPENDAHCSPVLKSTFRHMFERFSQKTKEYRNTYKYWWLPFTFYIKTNYPCTGFVDTTTSPRPRKQ